jgi:hypothetical protein
VQNAADLDSAEQTTLRAALGDRNQNINAIAHEGAPIADLTRPFTMTEMDMKNVPEAYTQLGKAEMLDQYAMLHGTGINRWQPFGTFAMESNLWPTICGCTIRRHLRHPVGAQYIEPSFIVRFIRSTWPLVQGW